MHSYCVQHNGGGLCAELPGTRAEIPGLNFHKATDTVSLISQSHKGLCRPLRLSRSMNNIETYLKCVKAVML